MEGECVGSYTYSMLQILSKNEWTNVKNSVQILKMGSKKLKKTTNFAA